MTKVPKDRDPLKTENHLPPIARTATVDIGAHLDLEKLRLDIIANVTFSGGKYRLIGLRKGLSFGTSGGIVLQLKENGQEDILELFTDWPIKGTGTTAKDLFDRAAVAIRNAAQFRKIMGK